MPNIPITASEPRPAAIYLASQSPRRQQLLGDWGVDFSLLEPDAHEDLEALEAVRQNEAPLRYVRRVTELKVKAAVARLQRRGWPPRPVLCADTTVALGRDILGKPGDESSARSMLMRLSGQRHRVLTAVAMGLGERIELVVSCSWVRFCVLGSEQIDAYLASGQAWGKAGAYGIQGSAALWVSHLSGSYSGVMGLPAFETGQMLRRFGVNPVV